MAHILAMRFSALGDVAMTVPVLYSFATHYPQHEITILTHRRFSYLFDLMPPNVSFCGVDLRAYRGIIGLNNLYHELTKTHYDAIADFHNVLRTKFLRTRFKLEGTLVATVDKGTGNKRRLTRKRGKEMEQLLTSPERYARVLAELGYPTRIAFRSVYGDGCGPIDDILPLTGHKGTNQWVGIAPFAQHRGKVYPTELMEQVVQQVAARDQVQVFLFGGGTEEQQKCEAWAKTYPSVTSLVGKSDLRTELHVMSHLDVMVSMDSANMHLASIVATPVVSIWGATHPYAGFMGWQQSTDNAIQLDLPCRPCSVYGKKPCALGTYACLYGILPTRIVERVVHLLEYKRKKETNL